MSPQTAPRSAYIVQQSRTKSNIESCYCIQWLNLMPDFSQVYKMFKINVFNVDFGFNDVYNLNNSYQIICICLTVIDFVALFLKVR